MQSRWQDPPCGSRPEALTRAGLPVVQPETLRYSGSSVFSWFFWIGKLAVQTTRRRDFGGCKGRIRGGFHGEERRRGAQTASKRFLQLRNWHCIARYAMREEQALRPTSEFSYLRVSQAGDDGCGHHGAIHKAVAIIGKDQGSTGVTCCPVGVARARHGSVVDNKGSGAESPDWIRSITKITNHVGVLSWIAGSKLAPAGDIEGSENLFPKVKRCYPFKSMTRTMDEWSTA